MLEHNTESQSLLLARVVRDLLAAETFVCLPDLTEALKRRCGRLKIRWTNEQITEAYRLIASNRQLVTAPKAPTPVPVVELQPLSRPEAARIYAELRARYQPAVVTASSRDGWPEHFPDLVEIP